MMEMTDGGVLASIWFSRDERIFRKLFREELIPRKMQMQKNHTTYRYSEHNGRYLLQAWTLDNTDRFGTLNDEQPVANRPEWLLLILNIAEHGEHTFLPPNPPPEKILWFTTDENHNLVSFENAYGDHLIKQAAQLI